MPMPYLLYIYRPVIQKALTYTTIKVKPIKPIPSKSKCTKTTIFNQNARQNIDSSTGRRRQSIISQTNKTTKTRQPIVLRRYDQFKKRLCLTNLVDIVYLVIAFCILNKLNSTFSLNNDTHKKNISKCQIAQARYTSLMPVFS